MEEEGLGSSSSSTPLDGGVTAITTSDEQLSSVLQHMLVSVEKGIERMRWQLLQTSLHWAGGESSVHNWDAVPLPSITVIATDVEYDATTAKDVVDSSILSSTLCSQTSSCCCCGLHSVDLKDFGVQTSPVDEHKDGNLLLLLENSGATVDYDPGSKAAIAPPDDDGGGGDGGRRGDDDDDDGSSTSVSVISTNEECHRDVDESVGDSYTASVTGINEQKQLEMSKAGAKDSSGVSWDDGVATHGTEEADDGYHDNSIIQPSSIFEVDQNVLNSGVAILPGCRDRTGRVVVAIDLNVIENGGNQITASKLAQILMYFHAVPRKEVVARGFLIFVDARKHSHESLSLLDESFSLLEGNISGAVNTVVVWRTHTNNISGMETSPRKMLSPFPQSGVKFEVVHFVEEVRKLIKTDQLAVPLGGEYVYDHERWLSFRKMLEPFMQNCRAVGLRLISVMQEMKGNCLPSSSLAASQAIEQHKKFVGRVLDDTELVQLQHKGPDILRELEETRRLFSHNHDFREAVEKCSALYGELQRAIVRFVRLTDKKLRKLEHCLQLRTFEEETAQVLTWLSKIGEESLNKHSVVASSLGGVKAQERDFEKFYFLAMRHIEKGNDLLEEAATIVHKESTGGGGLGMKDLAKSLKQRLSKFSIRLEDKREKLEDNSKCYQLLDKAYEWALEAMKFISRLKMDQYTSPDELIYLMNHLRRYLESHPPLSEETFTEMIDLATKLDNDRLLDQCKVAQIRCRETAELIRTRQQTLLKAKQQLESECLRQRHRQQEQILDQVSEAMATRSPKTYQPTAPLWMPYATSTPCYPYARRRSVSGLPYNLVTSSFSYFGVGSAPPSHRRHDSLCANMLISEEQDENCDSVIPLSSEIPLATDDDAANVELRNHATTNDKDSDEKSPSATSGVSVCSGDSTSSSEKVSSEETISASVVASSSSSLTHFNLRLMKRSQTWQFEDEVWDSVPLRPQCLGQLVKNTPTRGSAESIPSLTENEDNGIASHNSKLNSGYPPLPVNTHLHQRGSSLNLQFQASSMADLRPSDEQIKQRKTVLLIMREMIQTERDYVKSLEYIIENYIPELLRDDIPQALRGKRNVIFGNIEKIYEFHSRYFLHELEQCETSPSQVGPCFLQFESHFYLYALYNKNKPKSDNLMAEYGSSFFKSKQLELGDKMDLASYLLKPVQRMGKYSLLLKQLLKECSEKDPEYGGLTAAKEMVNFQLRHGNDLLAMDAIRECDVNLKEQGCLLRQDEFLVWQGKSRKCLRQVFLFEELILFSKARRDPVKKGHDIYQYKSSMKMADIGLTEQLSESNTKFEIWFRKRKLHDTHTIQAPNPEIRQAWIQEISKLLWKQALRNREMRLAEMSSMGIGNKPCLDIKPSEDQINDRSISISQLNKAPRFRNSIAVTSSAYLRNNKRPHSIISVSSSSSGSSQSSTGPFCGALNLGFDPNHSPKSRHRSVTQQSQCSSESGIIPDMSSLNYDAITECGSHSKVERSSSNASSDSIGICSLPISPESPLEEDAGIETEGQ